ncbi:MAG: Nramp family divalent metal transporter [Candidatus Coatesbacteria bacterium]|nr:MAG: Nramp family divalent metal transporter [Candidatus Coatesbacteria bacterium]
MPRVKGLALFLAVLGPGIITSNVDNDAGGIATYSICGAQYGYAMLWAFIPITLFLIVVQEMGLRMGVVTGKGLSDLIRERFGVRVTFYLMFAMLIINLGNTVAEFAGVAASLGLVGVSKYIAVPAAAAAIWLLVVKWNYKRVEKLFLTACLVYVSYIVAGFIARPDWGEVGAGLAFPEVAWEGSYFAMLVALVGTTVTPWMQFYLQAAVVEKGVKISEYRLSRWDVTIGSIVVSAVAFFIVVVCGATLFPGGIEVTDAADAAQALRPLAGQYASFLFGFGLLNASLFAASILPLSTAFFISEAFGWEAGVDKKFSEAPGFYSLFTVIIVVGALAVLWPGAPLFAIMYWSQVVNGVALPVVILCMLVLINDRRLMGNYVNTPLQNIFSGATAFVLTALSLLLIGIAVF